MKVQIVRNDDGSFIMNPEYDDNGNMIDGMIMDQYGNYTGRNISETL